MDNPREVVNQIKTNINEKNYLCMIITGAILKQLPRKIIVSIGNLINAAFRLMHDSSLWKITEVIIAKKNTKSIYYKSYRPIFLLPVISKLFGKPFLRRPKVIVEIINLIKDYQFGFIKEHSTTGQTHRNTNSKVK